MVNVFNVDKMVKEKWKSIKIKEKTWNRLILNAKYTDSIDSIVWNLLEMKKLYRQKKKK